MTTEITKTGADAASTPAEGELLQGWGEPAQLELNTRTAHGCAVVSVGGELDICTAGQLEEYVRRVIDHGHAVVMLNLSGVSFCDASGLRGLVRIGNHADGPGCRVMVAEPTPMVAKILRVGGLDHRFATVHDVPALRSASPCQAVGAVA
jgi:anti-anti-sigma factor